MSIFKCHTLPHTITDSLTDWVINWLTYITHSVPHNTSDKIVLWDIKILANRMNLSNSFDQNISNYWRSKNKLSIDYPWSITFHDTATWQDLFSSTFSWEKKKWEERLTQSLTLRRQILNLINWKEDPFPVCRCMC